jgi:methylated-DNA-protein-cysteine methyltransferase-like protein
MQDDSDSRQQRIWQALASVPEGKVVSYGQLAELAGLPGYARFVGATLKKLPKDTRLPWHRVINASGRISFERGSPAYQRQKQRLLGEGITVEQGRISLSRYRWNPKP